MPIAAAATAGVLAAAAYVDAKLHIRKDVETWYRLSAIQKKVAQAGISSPMIFPLQFDCCEQLYLIFIFT